MEQLGLFTSEVEQQLARPHHINVLGAAKVLQQRLWSGKLQTSTLRSAMTHAFGGQSDSSGAWSWKDAYEAIEIALVLHIGNRRAEIGRASPNEVLELLGSLQARVPTQTKRTEESAGMQQFSTPLQLAYLIALAGALTATDLVLEPSAGTGMLVCFARAFGAQVVLNELSEKRVSLLRQLFQGMTITAWNAEQIHDYLAPEIVPTVVLMNPPFSASPDAKTKRTVVTAKHVRSALLRLKPGGRLVAITGNAFSPINSAWKNSFARYEELGATVRLSIGIEGAVYYKHGTSFETRLTVIDKIPGAPTGNVYSECVGIEAILAQVLALPKRLELAREEKPQGVSVHAGSGGRSKVASSPKKKAKHLAQVPRFRGIIGSDISYEVIEHPEVSGSLQNALYETYVPRRIRIIGAVNHPTTLCESVAMASVVPPAPQYKPTLAERLVSHGILSLPQLEAVIYAGEAHSKFLRGYYQVDASLEKASVVSSSDPEAIRFRLGWFLGDGTGCGKGRQVAGIIMDNLLKGRKKAVWISKSAKLIEDARRDWCALGGSAEDVVPLSAWKLGEKISLNQGIVFLTYATLRMSKPQKMSRLEQLIDWLGADFEGVIAFDEAHAMGGAASERGERGIKTASLQGLTGLKLQNALPKARVLYVSATGASKVSNLAYASRLGLWGTGDFPFSDRGEFINSIQASGVAAMEVVCRDLKALGLYLARTLSFEGVQYMPLEVSVTPEQVEIYDAYAGAFQIIHQNLQDALQVSNGYLSAMAQQAAYSKFESHKQRFFAHLLMAIKTPVLIKSIEEDLQNGHAVIIQVVSTNEAMLQRRLAEVSPKEWGDLNIDITPREYVLDYLWHGFPTQLYRVYEDENGSLRSESVTDDAGKPVQCQEALAARDLLIEKLVLLPPIPCAIDQIIHHFGHGQVAEVTGRSVRVLKDKETDRLYRSPRSGQANLIEARAFMADMKRILIFSDAGGTGRSYHADLGCRNRRLRVHYLLESGWRADNAVQGLGRSHRTNQAQPPVFRPVTTNVRGERRFISTIARRLDALGALTRGQRQTGGQGLFRPEDNLESEYAWAALRSFYRIVYAGCIEGCSIEQFEQMTGLRLTDSSDGKLREELPPLPKFLNRLLALPIDLQNSLFELFERLLAGKIEKAIEAGTYEVGVETLRAEGFRALSREPVFIHAQTGAVTTCIEIEKTERNKVMTAREAINYGREQRHYRLMLNSKSKRVALVIPTASLMSDSGAVIERVLLLRPGGRERLTVEALAQSTWQDAPEATWQSTWDSEVGDTSPYLTSRIYLICGLLLPIWSTLRDENARVFRLQTDNSEMLLGRVVDAVNVDRFRRALGLTGNTKLSGAEIYQAVLKDSHSYELAGGLKLNRVTVMHGHRLQVTGNITEGLKDQLIAAGCYTEIIGWRLRVFVPVDEEIGPKVIERVIALAK